MQLLESFKTGKLTYVTDGDTSRECFTLTRQSLNASAQSAFYSGSFEIGENASV